MLQGTWRAYARTTGSHSHGCLGRRHDCRKCQGEGIFYKCGCASRIERLMPFGALLNGDIFCFFTPWFLRQQCAHVYTQ